MHLHIARQQMQMESDCQGIVSMRFEYVIETYQSVKVDAFYFETIDFSKKIQRHLHSRLEEENLIVSITEACSLSIISIQAPHYFI